MTARAGALDGVRVIDFCWVGAGSFATKILADHGADVVKIESSAKVDGLRLSPPFAGRTPGVNRSGYFADRNSSKRSMALNLKSEDGRRLALELIRDADVVANNFTPGVMERFGLGPEVALGINPRIVYLSMSMQGSEGPHRHHVGYGSTMAAIAGLHDLTGESSRDPIGTGTNYPDHIPNPTHAAIAVLAAVRHSRRSGHGQVIDIAQVEPMVSALGAAILQSSLSGMPQHRRGNHHPTAAPHNVYLCAGEDRWIAIAAMTDDHWNDLVTELGLRPPVAWASATGRKAAEAELDRIVADAVAGRDAIELARTLNARGVPAGVVSTAADLVDDPQLIAREHWQRLEHPEMGRTTYASPPFRLSATPGRLSRPAPLLGEHTIEAAEQLLGISSDEAAKLVRRGVLR